METDHSFRVNSEYLGQHKSKMVTIVGRIVDKSSDPYIISTTDSKSVRVHKNPSLNDKRFSAEWIEVTGRVQENLDIEESSAIPITSKIDPEAWNQMVKLSHKFKEIF
ncbi:hypothetical protein TVAG_487720 [Trichomonas vaginalis G3]|uniref:Uncharacterized protein n=1 Tax=Trichomonas vaginalis (strain ATCC PRA-98 / G3) TaxID=412133 RepID=A2EFQ0_TRIV3|nr:single-stranded DNA binding protein 12k chain [Trichomonas vaginalis G3]EAY08545.1 hypothetical protein TVAG_487720 [Trichomonas vaginalis G3]KAI5542121.1 single-stranded DNA binding protein 12k chain [Trichomonas vaginalis G3]|eukprot:XP_001320768.1 hypothetical protein [Trichomonas vaginalis G3]